MKKILFVSTIVLSSTDSLDSFFKKQNKLPEELKNFK